MKYSLGMILYSSIVLVACSKQPKSVEPPQAEQPKVVDENIEVLDDTSEFEDYMEPENGIYESDFVEEDNLEDVQVTEIGLKELVQQFKDNPAMVELMTFRTTGRIQNIKTETIEHGERIAIVGITSHKSDYGVGASFYCAMTLEEAAKFKPRDVIDFTGKIVNSGERAFHYDAYHNYTWKTTDIMAACHSAFLHVD